MSSTRQPPAPVSLRVEGMERPRAVATSQPRFSWQLPAGTQDAYEIELYRDGRLEIASGRVDASSTTGVRIQGLQVASRTTYAWRVRIWTDEARTPGDWSSDVFETALLNPAEWIAPWVTPLQKSTVIERYSLLGIAARGDGPTAPISERLHPPLHLRQEFTLDGAVESARLRMSARGIYVAELNGVRVGDEVLAPGYDSYGTRVSVQTYDVSKHLRDGRNALGVVIADGWYAGRIGLTGASAQYGDRLSATWQLEVRYADGRQDTIAAGPDVRSDRGPRDWADLFIGERYDARREIVGWSEPGYDDAGWSRVTVEADGTGVLVPFSGEPVRRTREFTPAAVSRTPSGQLLIDAGQVVAGRLRITIRAARGAEVLLEHTETLDRAGEYFDNILGPNKDQADVYIAAGRPVEVYEPDFTFHGFRYVRVTGLDDLSAEDVTIVVLGSDLRETSRFETSDPRLGQLHRNIVWSQRGNFLSIPTDCPQRERAGWTGDIQIFARTAATNMAVQPFLERWLANVRAEQRPNGEIPMVVPDVPHMDFSGTPITSLSSAGWGDAIVVVPWVLYERYGDPTVLHENYAAMKAWVEYQIRTAENELPAELEEVRLDPDRRARQALLWNTGFHYGDWLAPSTLHGRMEDVMVAPALTGGLTAAMFHAHALDLLARVAGVIGEDADAERYSARHKSVAAAFAAEYVGSAGELPVDLQGPYVLALAFNLIPEEQRAAAVARLVTLIHEADDHLDTGFISVPYLLDVLWDHGERDLARKLLLQDTGPSWLYQVAKGATTVWESWQAILPDGTIQPMSLNHYALGCVDDWMFRRLAGIVPTAPGYREFAIEPDLDGIVDCVSAAIDTPSGEIAIEWRRSAHGKEVHLVVPPNTTARLKLGPEDEFVGPGRYLREISTTA